MMKNKFYLTYEDKKSIERLIKNRNHIIDIMYRCLMQFVNSDDLENKNYNLGYFEIISNKNYTRLFINLKKKIFSFIVPFKVNLSNKVIKSSEHNLLIDSQILTIIKLLVDKDWFNERATYLDLYEKIDLFDEIFEGITEGMDIENYVKDKVEGVCRYLLSYEIGYLRYDDDEIGESENGRDLHPQYHIDINYTKSSSYKLGLNQSISSSELNYLINSEEKCYFLSLK